MFYKYTTLQVILLFGVLASLSSCNGQSRTKEDISQPNRVPVGKAMMEFNENIWAIYQDQKGYYWFASNGNGVFFYDGKSLKQFTKEDGLSSNQVRTIQEDKLGNLYFESPDGITKYNGSNFTILKPVSFAQNEWKLEPDDLWFKANGDINSIYRYDGNSLFPLKLPEFNLEKTLGLELENSRFSPFGVYSLYKDKMGNIWFGTFLAGVYCYDGDSGFWISEKELTILDDGRAPGIRSIIEDKDGNFWFSNVLHRYKVYLGNHTTQEMGLKNYEKLAGVDFQKGPDQMVFPYYLSGVIDDENADLWIATYEEGVWRFDGENFTNYPVLNAGAYALLTIIYKDNKGIIWVGTQNNGVFKFNGKTFEKFLP